MTVVVRSIVDEVAAAAEGDERRAWASIVSHLLEGDHDETLERWFGVAPLRGPHIEAALDRIDRASVDVPLLLRLGVVFEERRATDHDRRRGEGAFFTPAALAARMVKELHDNLTVDARICDPAAGAGAFLLPLLDIGVKNDRARPMLERIYGIDIDDLTVAVLRSFLWLASDLGAEAAPILEHNIRISDSIGGERWPQLFGVEEFAAIIGNPPWTSLRPTISRWSGDDTAWAAHASERRDYSRQLRELGYRLQGRGDADTYRFFLERAIDSVGEEGVVWMLVPGALMRADGAALLRRHLLETGTIEQLIERLNVDRAFDIHAMFRYVELRWRHGSGPGGVARLSLGNPGLRHSPARGISLNPSTLLLLGGDSASIPDIRTPSQRSLLVRLMRSHAPLTERAEWNVTLRREIDVTGAGRRFVRADVVDDSPALPLYEGRMVHQHDSMAKAWVSGSGRSAIWQTLPPSGKRLGPQFYVPAETVKGRVFPVRAGYCDITGHANQRTVLAAMLPAGSIAGNKVPTVEFDSADPHLPLIWVALANTFVIDWLMRRRVSTTINHFFWGFVPFPRVDPKSADGAELAFAARNLMSWEGEHGNLATRAAHRLAIEAVAIRLFGLHEADVAEILADFPLLDRGQAPGVTSRSIQLVAEGASVPEALAAVDGIPFVPGTHTGPALHAHSPQS